MDTRKSIWVLSAILVISAWVLGSFTQGEAETLRIKVTSYSTQVEIIQVGDMEGHILMPHVRRGLAFFENGDVATYTFWGTADLIKGKGTPEGYTMFTFEDGSTIVYKVKGIWEPGPRGLAVGKGTGEFTKGTGRYEGIKGDLTWSGKYYTSYSKEKGTLGDSVLEATATYTLPRK
jgi:hypothetical protein